MDYNSWTAQARAKIDALSSGEIFELKDLFTGMEWGELSPAEKRSFGRFFSSEQSEGRIPNINRYDDGKRGANKYIKE